MQRICVFCGSRLGRRAAYRQGAVALGQALLARQLGVVYGGSGVGLMGMLADTVLDGGGEVIGVIPEMMTPREAKHTTLSELHVVPDMHQRKALMAQLADAFIALPGGYGTLEEVLEQLTWGSIGLHAKPVGLLNVAGFYDPLVRFIRQVVDEGFLPAERLNRLYVTEDAAQLVDQLLAYKENVD